MTTTPTMPAPAACSAWPESACAPRTLDDALVYLAGVWPGTNATPGRLAAFYQHAAEVYAAVKDGRRGMQVRAAAYTVNARLRAEYYAAQAATIPAGVPGSGEPAWPALPPARAGHAPDRPKVRCPR